MEDEVVTYDTDKEVYEKNVKKMNSDYRSGKWSFNNLCSLMEATFQLRKKYLESETTVVEVKTKFPLIQEPSLVSRLYFHHKVV